MLPYPGCCLFPDSLLIFGRPVVLVVRDVPTPIPVLIYPDDPRPLSIRPPTVLVSRLELRQRRPDPLLAEPRKPRYRLGMDVHEPLRVRMRQQEHEHRPRLPCPCQGSLEHRPPHLGVHNASVLRRVARSPAHRGDGHDAVPLARASGTGGYTALSTSPPTTYARSHHASRAHTPENIAYFGIGVTCQSRPRVGVPSPLGIRPTPRQCTVLCQSRHSAQARTVR